MRKFMIFGMCIMLGTTGNVTTYKRHPNIIHIYHKSMADVEVKDGYLTEDSVKSICRYVGKIYDISPEILQAIMYSESRYKVNPGKGTYKGLCQINPTYCKKQMKKLGIVDILDPLANVHLCGELLNEYRKDHDLTYAIMAYSMGPNKAKSYLKKGKKNYYVKHIYKLEKKFKEDSNEK